MNTPRREEVFAPRPSEFTWSLWTNTRTGMVVLLRDGVDWRQFRSEVAALAWCDEHAITTRAR